MTSFQDTLQGLGLNREAITVIGAGLAGAKRDPYKSVRSAQETKLERRKK